MGWASLKRTSPRFSSASTVVQTCAVELVARVSVWLAPVRSYTSMAARSPSTAARRLAARLPCACPERPSCAGDSRPVVMIFHHDHVTSCMLLSRWKPLSRPDLGTDTSRSHLPASIELLWRCRTLAQERQTLANTPRCRRDTGQ